MSSRIVIVLVVIAISALTLLFLFSIQDKEYTEKTARLLIENNSGETITNVVVSLTGEPCKIESLANDEQAECVFTDLITTAYKMTFVRPNGETISKTDLGHVTKNLFWNDKITLGEAGEHEITRALPQSHRVDFSN